MINLINKNTKLTSIVKSNQLLSKDANITKKTLNKRGKFNNKN